MLTIRYTAEAPLGASTQSSLFFVFSRKIAHSPSSPNLFPFFFRTPFSSCTRVRKKVIVYFIIFDVYRNNFGIFLSFIAIKHQIIVLKFANIRKFSYLCSRMIVTFEQTYLQELYTEGKASDKKHRFQPQIVSKYVKVVNLMKQQENVLGLAKYGSLHYEKLHGDKEGVSSVRVNDQYRIEFTESMEAGKQIATICNITELSNHYK